MPRARRQVEIWSDIQAAGGSRLAVIPDVTVLMDTVRLTGEHELTLELPIRSPAYSSIQAQRVARVTYEDGTFDEWRLTNPEEKRAGTEFTATLTGKPVREELGRAIVARTEADGSVWHDFEALGLTITEHFNSFVGPALTAYGKTYFALGTVDSSAQWDLVYSWSTALDALIRLAAAANLEFHVRRNGTTQYLIDLVTAIGSAAEKKHVRLGRDLMGITRRRDTSEQMTRIIPRGANEDGFYASMARARWRVASVAGSDVVLEDADGGAGPIGFDDQLNGLYLRKTNGTLTQVSDSVASSQTVTVASAASISAGHIIEFRADSAGTELTYLEQPADKTTYGLIPRVLDRSDIPSTINLVSNPAVRSWSAGEPVGWSAVSTPTITETTTTSRWRTAGRSARVETNADGEGIEVDAFTVAPTAAKPFFSAYVALWVESGRVRVEFVTNAGLVIPNGGTDGKAYTSVTGQWLELKVEGIDLEKVSATTIKFRIVQDGSGTADFYVDAAQITQTPTVLPLMIGAGPTKLWQEGNRTLLRKSAPLIQIAIDLVDLHRYHPIRFPATSGEELVLGGTVRAIDAALGVDVTTRFASITRDLLKHGVAKVELTNRREDLIDRFARQERIQRRDRDPIGVADHQLAVRITRVSETDDDITVRVAAIGASATIARLGTLTASVAYDAGGLTVSPSSPQTLSPVTADFATTDTQDFTITRPGQGQKPSRVAFTATGSGHRDGTDSVDVYPKGWRFRCKVYDTNLLSQTVSAATWTAITFDNEYYDVGGLHSTSSNPSRITIPTGGDNGVWRFLGQMTFQDASSGANQPDYRGLQIRKNGSATPVAEAVHAPTAFSASNYPSVLQIAHEEDSPSAGDYFELFVAYGGASIDATRSFPGGRHFWAAQHSF